MYKQNRDIMSAIKRLERNDAMLTHLLCCEPPTTIQREGKHFETTYMTNNNGSTSISKLQRICNAIATNTRIVDVCFDSPFGLSDVAVHRQPRLFEGLTINTSINSLGISRCNLSVGVGYQVLNAYKKNSQQLTKLAVWRCLPLHSDSIYTLNLCSTLSACTNLQELSITSCGINCLIVSGIVDALKGGTHAQLEKLDLQKNSISDIGAVKLANLLKGMNCNIKVLALQDNIIGNLGARSITKALSINQTLEAVYLDGNRISEEGWDAFTSVLCNPSSLDATYSSNHTLTALAGNEKEQHIPNELLSLLQLNKGANQSHIKKKSYVIRQKILQTHLASDFDIEPFTEEGMIFYMIPQVLAWVGRDEEDVQSHSAMFSLLKEMPTLCAPTRPSHPVKTSEKKTEHACCIYNEDVAKRQQLLNLRKKGKSKLGSFLGSVPRRFKGGMKDYKQKVVYSRAA